MITAVKLAYKRDRIAMRLKYPCLHEIERQRLCYKQYFLETALDGRPGHP
jgi:hypothetical protein